MSKKIEKSIDLAGKKLTLSTGHVASQATSAVMAQLGETVVLAAIMASPLRDDPGYFPLQVNYMERLYAGGRIKGSRWVKREGKPLDSEILTARLIDRSIRPLFPKGYKKDVQIIITVMSVDMENGPDMVAAIATSAALAASSIPWDGPIAPIKVGLVEDKFVVSPVKSQLKEAQMELIVSSTKDAIVMIECGSLEIPEEKVLEGIELAQKEGKKVLKLINDLAKQVGAKKEEFVGSTKNSKLTNKVKALAKGQLSPLAKKMATKEAGYEQYNEIKSAILDELSDEDLKEASGVFDELFNQDVKDTLLSGKRPDGRKNNELRALSSQISFLPRTHGSAVFQRGQTQALSVVTLGSPSLEQLIESVEGEESKRYMHHYTFPPYSVGETGRFGFPSRREIGHGALAEKAIMPVLPTRQEFPYTIRVVTEILSSNGSTSMAATCGSILSMMDAGVPLKSGVSGIAMGLVIKDEKNYTVLTDIVGLEDGAGDMDFKVAGTKKGITALQLDVKTLSLTSSMLKDAFAQAKKARAEILANMTKAISKPKTEVNKYAPKIDSVKIPQDKIGELIGPGGKMIKKIMADTETQVDVDDDGTVSITAETLENLEKAKEIVEGLAKVVEAGEIYEGEVARVESYGAFVEILTGKSGMVHVSDMGEEFTRDANDKVKVGDKVKVRVKEVDNLGRINLSMNMDPESDKKQKKFDRPRGRDNDRRGGGGRRDYGRGRRDFSRDRRNSSGGGPRSSGPHFPASKLVGNDSPPQRSHGQGRQGRSDRPKRDDRRR